MCCNAVVVVVKWRWLFDVGVCDGCGRWIWCDGNVLGDARGGTRVDGENKWQFVTI